MYISVQFCFDCTEKAFRYAHFVTVWSVACTGSENWDTLGPFLSGWPISLQVLHCLSLEMMTCLPLDILTPLVWQRSLMTQVQHSTFKIWLLSYYFSFVYNKITFYKLYCTGSCWVHHWCAVWSEGVKRFENDKLENVDKAVISGTQRVSLLSIDMYQVGT